MDALRRIDRDGALEEGIEKVSETRAGFLGKAAVAAGGLVGGAAVLAAPALGQSGSLTRTDVDILNFALTLEELEAAFYADALTRANLQGDAREFAQTAGAHETAHVKTLRDVLGGRAIAAPTFDFGAATQSEAAFLRTAITLEDTGVAAYKGQAPRIRSRTILAAALGIHSVEAKHAAWVRRIAKGNPSPAALEGPRTMGQVLAAVRETGFIRSS